jgi:hypothetical protein
VTRWLIGLAAAQLVAVGMLALKIGALESRIEDAIAADAGAAGEMRAAPSPTRAASQATTIGAEEIRAILREELAAHANSEGSRDRTFAANEAPPTGASLAASPPPDPAVASAVRAEFQSHLSRGRISKTDMATLQLNMAKLPPAERTQLLRELTKAMNDGRLAGEF